MGLQSELAVVPTVCGGATTQAHMAAGTDARVLITSESGIG